MSARRGGGSETGRRGHYSGRVTAEVARKRNSSPLRRSSWTSISLKSLPIPGRAGKNRASEEGQRVRRAGSGGLSPGTACPEAGPRRSPDLPVPDPGASPGGPGCVSPP